MPRPMPRTTLDCPQRRKNRVGSPAVGKTFHLHLVSDATGETVHGLARACVSQFEDVEPVEHTWSMVRTRAQVERVIAGIEANPGVVLFTLVDEALRGLLQGACRRLQVPTIPILDPIIGAFASYLGRRSRGQPGRQHALDAEYFNRIDAMTFALVHDDGQGLWNLDAADVVLTGVSRTSKTPTAIYLANRGIKVANVPIVPGVPPPEELFQVTRPLVVGLTKDPESLVEIRRQRLRMIQDHEGGDYVDLESVRQEIAFVRRMCSQHRWPVIDVSRRSIEETAAAIMQLLARRQGTPAP